MVYESSYESGRRPFNPDTTRGHWAHPNDFIYICLGLALKLDFFFTPMTYFGRMGIFAFIPYLICVALYVVPIMVIQSFIGQFSSSSFISAFRVSPFFKGMGYVSLVLNFLVLTYYSVFATVPLLFFINSLRPTLPWSCEVFENPTHNWNVSKEIQVTICNITDPKVVDNMNNLSNDTRIMYELPSVLFFKSHFVDLDFYGDSTEFGISWEMVGCTVIVWYTIAGIFYKFFNASELGKILRFAIWGTLAGLLICLVRFSLLPGALDSLGEFIYPEQFDPYGIVNVLIYTVLSFGPGWGSIISISSFNKFNTNIMRDSWIICIGQMFIFVAFNISGMLVEWHFSKVSSQQYFSFFDTHWDIYLSTGSAISNMRFPNFWSLLFYGVLTTAAIIVMVTQLFSLLVAIFDEFEVLREQKVKVTFILIGVSATLSLYLCSNDGIIFFSPLSIDSLFTSTALTLLLLLVMLWVYGRERFQRDIEFMLSAPFATWKVNVLRFVAPLSLIFILFISIAHAVFEHMFSNYVITIVALICIALPWLSVPGYGCLVVVQGTGSWMSRIKRACRPTDWYPVEQEDRQRYEDSVGNENITHQLNEIEEEVL